MHSSRSSNFKKKNKNEKNKDEKDIILTFDGIPVRKLYVTNLAPWTTWQRLHEKFSQYGEVKNVFIPPRSPDERNKTFAFVTFVLPESATRVLRYSKVLILGGRRIYISAADSWHQPRVLPDGTVEWNRTNNTRSETHTSNDELESDEDDKDESGSGGQLVCEVVTEDGINRLNDDCLRHIFTFLDLTNRIRLERVCKKWQRVSLSMWRSIHSLDLSEFCCNNNKPLTTKILEQFLRRCSVNLRSIHLFDTTHSLNGHTLPSIAKHCPNIENIEVSHLNIGNRSLAHLAMSCTKLKSLSFNECLYFSDHDLNLLLAHSKELNTLDLTKSMRVTGSCLTRITGPLCKLSLDRCTSIIPQNLISGLNNISATLTNLSLSACSALGCNDVARIVQTIPNLTSLSLCDNFPLFNHKSLLPIGELVKLEELNLSQNPAVNDDVIRTIVYGCPDLKLLNLSGVFTGSMGSRDHSLTETGISLLAKLHKLTDLNISYLDQTTNASLKNLTLRSSPPLQRLICVGCPLVSNEGCNNVVSLCNELVLFDISGCDKVTDVAVKTAEDSVKLRTNNKKLTMVVGGTAVLMSQSPCEQLHIDKSDNSEEHLRPDFMDGMFFSPSGSEDDLVYLCDNIGCNCGGIGHIDFDIDDDCYFFEEDEVDSDYEDYVAYPPFRNCYTKRFWCAL